MVIILRGISGSGKSTVARNFVNKQQVPAVRSSASQFLETLRSPMRFELLSADDYFMVGSEYKFDPKYLSAAHESCLRMFASKLEQAKNTDSSDIGIVVDNTNTTLVEVVPYIALGQAYAHELHVITLVADPMMCATRNNHGAPFSSIIRQDVHLKQSILNWPQNLARYQQIFPH